MSVLPYLYFYGPQQVRLKFIFIGKLLFIGVGALQRINVSRDCDHNHNIITLLTEHSVFYSASESASSRLALLEKKKEQLWPIVQQLLLILVVDRGSID